MQFDTFDVIHSNGKYYYQILHNDNLIEYPKYFNEQYIEPYYNKKLTYEIWDKLNWYYIRLNKLIEYYTATIIQGFNPNNFVFHKQSIISLFKTPETGTEHEFVQKNNTSDLIKTQESIFHSITRHWAAEQLIAFANTEFAENFVIATTNYQYYWNIVKFEFIYVNIRGKIYYTKVSHKTDICMRLKINDTKYTDFYSRDNELFINITNYLKEKMKLTDIDALLFLRFIIAQSNRIAIRNNYETEVIALP